MGEHILIVGSGSAGRRHARNLAALGCSISAVDPRPERCEELARETALEGRHESLAEALAAPARYDGAVVASPPLHHVPQAVQLLERAIPLLLEKPLAPDLGAAQRLHRQAVSCTAPVLLGYTWRWWPPLMKLRRRLMDGAIGPLRHASFVMSAHLADWHPWEPYQEFFMASAELGGGALLDESHWIDLMLWMFGPPLRLFARIDHVSDLEIETDDHVDLLVDYGNGLRVSIHLDLYGRPHEKSIRLVGENGTLLWTAEPNRISLARGAEPRWEHEEFECERNDMFVAEAREFLAVLRREAKPSCTLDDGLEVLALVEAARESHATGRAVALPGRLR